MKDIIVIPTYNEKENISALVPEIFKIVPDVYVVVADDNSPDGTADAVRVLMQSYPRLSLFSRRAKEGLGRAYAAAFQKLLAESDVRTVIMMDADFSHHPRYLPAMLAESRAHSVVVGSRYVSGGGTEGWEGWRRLLSFGGNRYARLVTGLPIFDLTGGFNIIHTELLRKIDLSAFDASGYAFIIELKYRLWKAGADFAEVPIIFKNRREGESKISNHIIAEGIIAPWKMRFKK